MRSKTNKIKEIPLTFGFELEGRFAKKFNPDNLDYLPDGSAWHYDGSVNVSSSDCDVKVLSFEEYCSPVFKNTTDLLKDLNRFKNNKNYFSDESCGLHLHVGTSSANKRRLINLCANYNFLTALHKYALSFCSCQKYRLQEKNGYCYNYKKDNFIREIKDNTKYRFCRWHPQGTLEFRFLSPCSHKTENTIKTIDFIKSYLLEKEKIAELSLFKENQSKEKETFNYKIDKKENLILNYVLS